MVEFITWFATGFGLGYSPILPGTAGALPGLLLVWFVTRQSRRTQWVLTIILMVVAVPICDIASDALGGKDNPKIVADEFMTLPAAVIGQSIARQPLVLGGVFVVSRVFDGLKPAPVRQAEAIDGGLGIVLDDLAANIYVWLLLFISYRCYRRFRRDSGAELR